MALITRMPPFVLVGASAALLGGTVALGGMARATAAPRQATAHSAPPAVIQGSITAIHGMTITIRTPAQRPPCGAGQICPMYVIAGTTFVVDTSAAMHEGANGQVVRDRLAVGARVVVVGTIAGSSVKGAHRLRASVIERIVTATSAPPVSKGQGSRIAG